MNLCVCVCVSVHVCISRITKKLWMDISEILWRYERLGNRCSRWIQEPLVVRDRDGKPPRGPTGSALLLCVCSGSALLGLGDLLVVSRSMERDLSVLSIYPRILLHVFIVYLSY